MRRIWKPAAAVVSLTAMTALVLGLAAAPLAAAPVENASASAYGLRVHATLLGNELLKLGPLPYAAVPDADDTPDEASAAFVNPIRTPEDGSLISDLRVLWNGAERSTAALASARGESQVAHVALFERDGVPLIEADLIHSVSTTTCTGPNAATASAEGSRLVGLFINGEGIDATPDPNTTIPLTHDGGTPADPTDDRGIKVILNEQTGATRGTGLIVTMVHVIVYDAASPNLIFADIKIAQAQSSVFCGADTPPTDDNGDERGVESDKVVTSTTSDVAGATDGSQATAFRGDTVTWEVTLTNNGEVGCGIVTIVDTLPAHFTFESTSGDFSEAVEAVVDGRTVTWSNPARYSLPAGETLTEVIVATVDDDAPFGTYTNLVDIDDTTCSSFTQGLRGEVEVIPRPTQVLPEQIRRPTLPTTGSSGTPVAAVLAGFGILTAGAISLRLSRIGLRQSRI